ncbi:MAG: DNA-directed DNA polymerase eta rad30 [Vezdaea aestivalis]|nr:MAG: DNA-directed DNA polymerase eta rad30 [Vezdaea aestivalis]
MSSQPEFLSSPHPRSRFTFKTLASLLSGSSHSPLRVIALIDLDAFYAQCEAVRLDYPPTTPLAVQQWGGLIAVNYPARACGITRHMEFETAREKCPELRTQHVATWREGDETWAYHEDAAAHISTHKVSLDPYRRESRKIVRLVDEVAPEGAKVEKASVDEVFIDLSIPIGKELLDRYPELKGPPPYDDVSEEMPRPPNGVLNWDADAVVDLDEAEREEDDPDWDDVAIAIGAEMVRGIRKAVFDKFKYTCSAGIARNKMLAKLGAGHKKPNSQTIVRNRAVSRFLGELKVTKIRNLGGKLGGQVVEAFGSEEATVKDILNVTLAQMKKKLGDDTGSWVYQTIRGTDTSEVNPRTQIKSMLSAKSFRPSINTFEQGARWLRIFVADIFSRLVEEGVLENKRRPRTINLHHRHSGQTKSRQAPIPQGRSIDEAGLFDLAKTLFRQIIAEGNPWPCANLSLSVGGFEDGITGNQGIGAFLVKGEEAKSLMPSSKDKTNEPGPQENKKRKLHEDDNSRGMARFLARAFKDKAKDASEIQAAAGAGQSLPHRSPSKSDGSMIKGGSRRVKEPQTADHTPERGLDSDRSALEATDLLLCERCGKHVPSADGPQHDDWHFAKTVDAHQRSESRTDTIGKESSADKNKTPSTWNTGSRKPTSKSKKNKVGFANTVAAASKVDKSQRRLAFTE